MALTTFAELQAAIADHLNRTDLTPYIPDFVRLFETEFDADPRTAHHRRRICRSSAVISNEYESLPVNYLSVQTIRLATDPKRMLNYVDPDTLEGMVQQQEAWEANLAEDFGSDPAPPKYYTIVGTEIRFFPAPEQEYTCDFTLYERLENLSDDDDANWALTYFPHAYLYGSLLQAAPFLREDERVPMWRDFYERHVEACRLSDPNPTAKTTMRTELAGLIGRTTERIL